MKDLKPAIMMFIIFALICGGFYPTVITGIASVIFPKQAEGSFVTDSEKRVIGSSLIGQPFSAAEYFWPRPSATSVFYYNPLASGGSNSGPTNPDFIKTVADRIQAFRDSGFSGSIPSDLVEASASGLDPHISVEAANIQVARIAKARGISEEKLNQLVLSHTEDRQWGVFGEPRVNVLFLNLALDRTLR
jgi:potassium-transporting ATPase KdpC subunit